MNMNEVELKRAILLAFWLPMDYENDTGPTICNRFNFSVISETSYIIACQ